MESADLKRRLLERCPESRLMPVPVAAAESLRAAHPCIPEDYVRFLMDVGHGNIGLSRFKVYERPINPGNIYDEQTAKLLEGVLLIGDDFSGYCIGYDTGSNSAFGGVDSNGEFAELSDAGSFTEFIEDWFLRV